MAGDRPSHLASETDLLRLLNQKYVVVERKTYNDDFFICLGFCANQDMGFTEIWDYKCETCNDEMKYVMNLNGTYECRKKMQWLN